MQGRRKIGRLLGKKTQGIRKTLDYAREELAERKCDF